MRKHGILALAALAALALTGCPGAARRGGAPAAATTVDVTLKDMDFSPKTLTVPKGRVTFRLHNQGPSVHNMSIAKLRQTSPDVPPGKTVDWTVDLTGAPENTLQFICSQPGHADAGMTGTLTLR